MEGSPSDAGRGIEPQLSVRRGPDGAAWGDASAHRESFPGPLVEDLALVFYWVADMDRAVAFYRDVLGLRLSRRDGSRWAEFDAGGRRFALHGAGEGQPVVSGGATAVFSVPDLDRAKLALEAHGVAIDHEGDVQDYARFASCRDPDGNTLQLIQYGTPK
jgi:predicted enzyme related to lactoylglutathione lyase